MPEMSDRVLEFTRLMYRQVIEALLDDPSDLLHPEREREPAAEISELRAIGNEIGVSFDDLLNEAHDFERDEIEMLETLVTREDTEAYLKRAS